MKKFLVLALCFSGLVLAGCNDYQQSSDEVQKSQQEKILKEASSQTGMPAITHFRERKMLKMIFEMRDDATVTYTYMYSPMTGKLVPFCESIGFPIPYSTQYTNPQKFDYQRIAVGTDTSVSNVYGVSGSLPQADPNSLFSPASAAGTWIMCKDPNSSDVKPVYSEPDLVTSPFKLQTT